MKYICLGYFDNGKHEGVTKDEPHANAITNFAPTGIGLVLEAFSLRKPP